MDRPLDNPINWSFRVGRLFDITIRVHVVFILCALVLIWMEFPKSGPRPPFGHLLVNALGTYAMLFAIVLLHEFGHCFGARHVGGEADEILLWPLGGLAYVSPPHKARAHMITALAGPMVNVVLCAMCSVVLVLWIGSLGAVPWNPLDPYYPVDPTILPTTAQFWVMRFFGLSYFILLINLVPVFPFDGGRIVQAWLWPRKGYRASLELATGTGMVGAIIIGLFGLFTGESWLLLMIAVFGYLTCWQTRKMLREHGDIDPSLVGGGFSDGYTFLSQDDEEERKPGFFARRRAKKVALRAQRERQRQRQHQQAVERILRKVSTSGVDSLTPAERRTLEEETQRQRMH
ncbi:MAG: site-2 protease family protein [Planctomycetota bacterium]